jgi:hypothetical protein
MLWSYEICNRIIGEFFVSADVFLKTTWYRHLLKIDINNVLTIS